VHLNLYTGLGSWFELVDYDHLYRSILTQWLISMVIYLTLSVEFEKMQRIKWRISIWA